MSAPRSLDERGAVTLLAVACLGLLVFVGAALALVVALVAAHRSAQAAADLAALAGASAVQHRADPCSEAADVAAANGARLTGCDLAGEAVTVTVSVVGPHWLGQGADLSARARAGPAP